MVQTSTVPGKANIAWGKRENQKGKVAGAGNSNCCEVRIDDLPPQLDFCRQHRSWKRLSLVERTPVGAVEMCAEAAPKQSALEFKQSGQLGICVSTQGASILRN